MDIVDKMRGMTEKGKSTDFDAFNRRGCGYYYLMMLCNVMTTVRPGPFSAAFWPMATSELRVNGELPIVFASFR